MKKVKLIVSMVLCMFLLVGCGNTLSNKDLRVLKENVTAHSVEIDKYITSREEYKNAVLLETVYEYADYNDDSEETDWVRIFSKYQLEDGSIIYFNTVLANLKPLGELPDTPIFLEPFEESEKNYAMYKSLAETGEYKLGDRKLKSVGEDVYAEKGDNGTTYYFVIE